jgi:PAS domain S-box-containing protein
MINSKLLQLAINASNDGVVIAEKEGEQDNILIYVNPAFERLTGYSSEEILYQDCRASCNPETGISQLCRRFVMH